MWSDIESTSDYLNYSEIAESIADIVSAKELLPVSIGVYGDWGGWKIYYFMSDRGSFKQYISGLHTYKI